MSHPAGELNALLVLGAGQADSPDPDLVDAKIRATVRYADPAAWITATAVVRAISTVKDLVNASLHEVGMVVTSDQGPTETMSAIAASAREGFSSPLRFPAASPGSLVGVSCIVLGFRGPTLNLALPPAQGVPTAFTICAGWLGRGIARYMVLATFTSNGPKSRSARAILLSHRLDRADVGRAVTPSLAHWLQQNGD